MVGGQHNMRNLYQRVATLGRLRTAALRLLSTYQGLQPLKERDSSLVAVHSPHVRVAIGLMNSFLSKWEVDQLDPVALCASKYSCCEFACALLQFGVVDTFFSLFLNDF